MIEVCYSMCFIIERGVQLLFLRDILIDFRQFHDGHDLIGCQTHAHATICWLMTWLQAAIGRFLPRSPILQGRQHARGMNVIGRIPQ